MDGATDTRPDPPFATEVKRDILPDVSTENSMTFRFWGVRGSIATPGPETVRYGGNTPCVEVRAGGRLLVLDGGTGLRGLGVDLIERGEPVEADLFLSHLHWDHIQGIPFFTPAFIPGNTFRIWGDSKGDREVQKTLERQMTDPNFPVPLSIMGSDLEFRQLDAGSEIQLSGVTVRTAALRHPNGCLGLRIDADGRSLVYTTDTEHDPDSGELDPNVVDLARGADVLIYDSMYTEAEYRSGKIGWGHSTYAEAMRVARAAGVKQLCFFHHEPTHDDDFLDARLAEALEITAEDDFEVYMAAEGPWYTV